jgi:hypothetical protein
MGTNTYTHRPTKGEINATALDFVNTFIDSDECSDDDKRDHFTDADEAIEWYNDLESNLDEGYNIEIETCN